MHVLVTSDGSESALRVAREGIGLLGAPDRVTVLTVITKVQIVMEDDDFEEPHAPPYEQERQWQEQIAEAEAAFARTVAVLDAPSVEQRSEAGDAGTTICDVARELGVDAIVVGTHHRRRGLARLGSGSITDYVVHHAPCAVLVVQ